MKYFGLFPLLFIIIFGNTLIAESEKTSEKTIYKKYLPAGELIKLVRLKNSATNTYAYSFNLYITDDSDEDKIWSKNILHYDVTKDFDVEKVLVFHNVSRFNNNLFLVYTFENRIKYDTIKKESRFWKEPTSKEIPSELSKTGVNDASIFTTDTGIYVYLENSENVKEYWLASANPPKLLWTSKNEKSRSTNTYQDWLEHIKTKVAKAKKAETKAENQQTRESAKDDDDTTDDAAQEDNADSKNADSNNSGSKDGKNTKNPANAGKDVDSTNKSDGSRKSADAQAKDVDSNDVGDNKSDKTNDTELNDESDILTYLGISLAAIIILTIVVLVLIPRLRRA
ncbi:MAG: hypothetical protein K8S87_04165 [Planctomycetes bacterium]|nr:hypothetical protein [Planctomycetota bacterium]